MSPDCGSNREHPEKRKKKKVNVKPLLEFNKNGDFVIWLVPFLSETDVNWVEGKCEHIVFRTLEEAKACLYGYEKGLASK